jgi:peptidoglycan-N-acetylglucosamine deacetylase
MLDITLTFDNGPTPGVTEHVLDVLARYAIRTTFFVLGRKLSRADGKSVAGRAHREGHWIGNHTWSHPLPFGQWPETADPGGEILQTQQELSALAHPDRLFRPAGGGGYLDRRLLNARALEYLRAQSMTLVLWNCVPRDWEEPVGWVTIALEQCRRADRPLLVLHDVATGAMDQLPRFIETVLDAGGRFQQEHPPDCVPMRRGEITGPIEQYLTVQGTGDNTR